MDRKYIERDYLSSSNGEANTKIIPNIYVLSNESKKFIEKSNDTGVFTLLKPDIINFKEKDLKDFFLQFKRHIFNVTCIF